MGLKEDYRLKKLKKEMHRLHCEITKCCDGEGGDGLSCEDLVDCPQIEIMNETIKEIGKSIPTNNSELVNDSNYLTCDDLKNCEEIVDIKDSIPTDVSDLTDNEEVLFSGDYGDLDNKPTIPTNNSELVNDSNYLVCEDLENCQEIIDIKDSIPTDVSDLSDTGEVLFSGDYNDLDNKPTIPTNNSELVNDSGYIACEDLENCQTIIDIKDSIPTDVSDLTDDDGKLFDGDYDSLSNKPAFKTVDGQSIIGVGDIPVGDSNVQSDWDEADSSSDAFIRNKPSIPIVNDGQLELNTSGIADGGTQNFSANQAGNTTFTVYVPGTDITLTFNNNILTVSSTTGQSDSVDLSSLVTDNTYVTSMSLSGNTLILTNNDNTTVQQDLSSILFDGDYNNLFNKPTIPTDVSDLTDTNDILLEYKGEQSTSPLFPKKGWFYKNTGDGVMYYFDGADWKAYAEGGGGGDIFIERSLPDLHVDIANNELVAGATYNITGVHRAHTVNGTSVPALYDDGRDLGTTIFLKAVSENKLESFGSGIFYNPKYDKQVQGFGIWSSDKSYSVTDIVFWGGYAWENLNGNVGSSIDILSLDGEWEKIKYDDEKFYNKVVDYIEYDIENDIITRRYDTVNEIDVSSEFIDIVLLNAELGLDFSPISLMQWGNDFGFYSGISGVGKISVKHTSFVELINFKGGYIFNVRLDNMSYLENVTTDNGSSSMFNVTLDNGSSLSNVILDYGSSWNNVTLNGASLYNVTLNNSKIEHNTFINFGANFSNQTYNFLNLSNIKFEGNTLGVGNEYTIPDLSSASIITDPNIPQKKVFGITSSTIKIQYWDVGLDDFDVKDITA